MRFACQFCGKAYNLPEERIAEKSNVKLKCRVCGAIVEVKKQGDVVAQILNDEGKRRVSEAPAPLVSIGPEDSESDEATQAISLSDAGLPEMPFGGSSLGASLSASFGFGSPALPSSSGFGTSTASGFGTPAASGLGAPALHRLDPPPPSPRSEGVPFGSPPPPLPSHPLPPLSFGAAPISPPPPEMPAVPVPDMPVLNGGHNSGGHNSGGHNSGGHAAAGHAVSSPSLGAGDLLAPVGASTGSAEGVLPMEGMDLMTPTPAPAAEGMHSTSMLLASFATGILIGIIVTLMFF
jgi:hypothetical protein